MEVYLEIRTENAKDILSLLEADKEIIEAEAGKKLEWKRRGKVQIKLLGEEASISDPPEKLNQIREWILEHLLKLKQVFDPRLEEILGQSPPGKG